MNALMDAALSAAERGWHVFPIVPGAKAPAAVKAWEQRATTDPDRIHRCWQTGAYNIGIACGPSGLVVADLDTLKPGQELQDPWRYYQHGDQVLAELARRARAHIDRTYCVTTGRGGTHLYYHHPDHGEPLRNTAKKLGPLIDTRAHGGYVLAAGSIVDGRPYTLAADLPVVALPGWLAEGLRPDPLPEQTSVAVALGDSRRDRYLSVAIERQLAHVSGAAQGERNLALYHSAIALGQLVAGGALKEQEIKGLLTQAAHCAGLRPAETRATIDSGLRAGARRPRAVST